MQKQLWVWSFENSRDQQLLASPKLVGCASNTDELKGLAAKFDGQRPWLAVSTSSVLTSSSLFSGGYEKAPQYFSGIW